MVSGFYNWNNFSSCNLTNCFPNLLPLPPLHSKQHCLFSLEACWTWLSSHWNSLHCHPEKSPCCSLGLAPRFWDWSLPPSWVSLVLVEHILCERVYGESVWGHFSTVILNVIRTPFLDVFGILLFITSSEIVWWYILLWLQFNSAGDSPLVWRLCPSSAGNSASVFTCFKKIFPTSLSFLDSTPPKSSLII